MHCLAQFNPATYGDLEVKNRITRKNKVQFSLLLGSLAFGLNSAHADQKLMRCESEVQSDGYKMVANVFIKDFAHDPSDYNYCFGKKGSATIAVTREGRVPHGELIYS